MWNIRIEVVTPTGKGKDDGSKQPASCKRAEHQSEGYPKQRESDDILKDREWQTHRE